MKRHYEHQVAILGAVVEQERQSAIAQERLATVERNRHTTENERENLWTHVTILALKNADRHRGIKRSGAYYRGGLNTNGAPHGLGRYDYDDGGYVVGGFVGGEYHGQMTWYNKDHSMKLQRNYTLGVRQKD